jgi:hypothetical protein
MGVVHAAVCTSQNVERISVGSKEIGMHRASRVRIVVLPVEFTMMVKEEEDLVPKLLNIIHDLETTVVRLNKRVLHMDGRMTAMRSSVEKNAEMNVPHREYILQLHGHTGNGNTSPAKFGALANKEECDRVLRNLKRHVDVSSVPGMTKERVYAMEHATTVQAFCAQWATSASTWDMWIGTILRAHVRKIIFNNAHYNQIQIVYVRDGYRTLGKCAKGTVCDCVIPDGHVERIEKAHSNQIESVYTHVCKGDRYRE